MNSEPNWAQAAQHMQETLGEGFKQAMGAFSTGQAAGLPQVDLDVRRATGCDFFGKAITQAAKGRHNDDGVAAFGWFGGSGLGGLLQVPGQAAGIASL